MTRLPRKQLTLAPAATYWAAIAWYLHAIPFPVWEKHLEHVYKAQEAGEEADPFSLASECTRRVGGKSDDIYR